MSSTQEGRICDGCGEPPMPGGADRSKSKLVRCSRCKSAWYHNQSCQRAAYPDHKRECKEIAKQLAAEATSAADLCGVDSCRGKVAATSCDLTKRPMKVQGLCAKHWRHTEQGGARTEYRLLCSDRPGMLSGPPPEDAMNCLNEPDCVPTQNDFDGSKLSIRRWQWRDGKDKIYIISEKMYMPTWDAVVTAFNDVDAAGDALRTDPLLIMGTQMIWDGSSPRSMPTIYRLN